jgi:hypothetical protein
MNHAEQPNLVDAAKRIDDAFADRKEVRDRTVDAIDVLRAENHTLRLQVASLQKQIKLHEVEALEGRVRLEQRELMIYRDRLAEKYCIDFTSEEIDADTGKVIPANSKK